MLFRRSFFDFQIFKTGYPYPNTGKPQLEQLLCVIDELHDRGVCSKLDEEKLERFYQILVDNCKYYIR